MKGISGRRVMVHEWLRLADGVPPERVATKEGVLLQLGIDCEELENGIGHFTTAVVEMPDGSVKNVPVNMISFIKEEDWR